MLELVYQSASLDLKEQSIQLKGDTRFLLGTSVNLINIINMGIVVQFAYLQESAMAGLHNFKDLALDNSMLISELTSTHQSLLKTLYSDRHTQSISRIQMYY